MTQMPLDYAKAARDEGQQRALEGAEADTQGWGDIAAEFLKRYAETHEFFPGFFVTAESEKDDTFPKPKNERAWGVIYTRAQKLFWIKKTDRRVPHPKRHASEAIVYR